MKIGSIKRKLTVKSYKIEDRETPEGKIASKIIIETEESEGINLILDEALSIDNKGIRAKGLWIRCDDEGNLRDGTIVALTLRYYNCDTLDDLIGKEIIALPKENNYLAICASDIDEKSLPWYNKIIGKTWKKK